MIVCIEITENEEIKELQKKVLANKRQTVEENEQWQSDTDKIDDYIFQCISDYISMRNADIDYIRSKSNIWEYQVCTDDKEELYML